MGENRYPIFNKGIEQLHNFMVKTETENLYYEIQSLDIRPKLYNRINFDFSISDEKEENRVLKNVFSQFFTLFLFKKMDDYIFFFEKEIINSNKNKSIMVELIDSYSNFEFKVEKIQGRYFLLLIDYKDMGDSIQVYEKNKNIQLLYNIFDIQNFQVNQLFFYIYPIFINYITYKSIETYDVKGWSNFFLY